MKDILSFIEKNESFLLATHINPEGDALGSAIALSLALESIGKKTVVYDKDGVPDSYKFLPGYERVSDTLPADTKGLSLILLDCNTPERAGIEKDRAFKNSAVIDHHETERDFGDVKWIEPHAPATGLMVFTLIKAMGLTITTPVAVNLYTAMAIDTGMFRFASPNAELLRAAAELIEAGVRPDFISSSLYEQWSAGRFRLLCMALHSIEVSND